MTTPHVQLIALSPGRGIVPFAAGWVGAACEERSLLTVDQLDSERITRMKVAYSVRRVDLSGRLGLVAGVAPTHGDLVLARVVEIGQHVKLELTTSRRAALYLGDEIVVGMGARYAPDQFETTLPTDLQPCDLVAAGGVAAAVRSKHSGMKDPTRLEPQGLLASADGRVLNVADGALPPIEPALRRVPTVLVAGTGMNAGKTTSMAALVHGLTRAGLRVGACQLTGTGAGGDRHSYADAGAAEVPDFTDLGLISTCGVPLNCLVCTSVAMHAHLVARGVDAVVMEIADGLLYAETAGLIDAPRMRDLVDGTVFAAGDAQAHCSACGCCASGGRDCWRCPELSPRRRWRCTRPRTRSTLRGTVRPGPPSPGGGAGPCGGCRRPAETSAASPKPMCRAAPATSAQVSCTPPPA